MEQSTSVNKTAVADKTKTRSVSFKSVALPAEHGSWSLVSEPIVLGMLVAPTWAGLALVIAAFF
ncbi:MAG TPA: YwiC-like family protein, partial [Promineifilum sp.]|nr:YwiC-like family protein [Promineifilum sp.]